MSEITVYKRDYRGNPVVHYGGRVVERGENWVRLACPFVTDDVDIGLMVFRRGDLLMEWFYSDRYYNIFQIHDVDTQAIKGWYCNIVRPAEILTDCVIADDLELDMYVSPAGDITLLDETEFEEASLSAAERTAALEAVEQLRDLVKQRQAPFHVINPR